MTNDKSLISELLTIYQGKFVVRVAVQVDGIVRATGMATAETLEAAEDKARERAIACFNHNFLAPIAPKNQTISALPTPPEIPVAQPAASLSEPSSSSSPPTPTESQLDFSYTPELEPLTKEQKSTSITTGGRGNSKSLATNSEPPLETDIFGGDFAADLFAASSSKPPLSKDNYESADLSSNYESLAIADDTTREETQSSADLATELQKIEVKLKEAKLKANDERECLETNYGKGSRYELTALQARDFNRYLELYSQTTQAVKELQELGWDAKEGPKYLQAKYSKNKRHQLTERELQGFLDYLQTERDRIGVS
ncbi:MAG: hypothetical protein CLLPBCKN_005849 [Chroococcidiopsis cubana SAG 39.79]|jgi:hypothetical protein|uniref:DRBM domain-containing protein n=1 Tax=Chroococcidiopsis cubana SAG 39.79 TaxID=388085 RepID=A0AB37UMV6_9CYAN|nr:hypothetical protein [Chroococcidiopsis cubana]MDZ4876429.1 hypothetical protein [Chroococcidiopsis cubana SAG 39.79]PSB44721.1 hypothetical protein C7B80_19575 [Cyanosarcina cf. burmensis CCALA 770]PSB54340.1 hypothetical protein C7B79_34990 [Chroococcidiopsis cubana CCALA 043]RUT12703.1 hypothetical protein DSM107010_20840 [Chroococcidiopsis cubana SAG 39.79]